MKNNGGNLQDKDYNMKIFTILFPPFSVTATQEQRPEALSVQDTHPHELLQPAQVCPGFQSREKLFQGAHHKPSSPASSETCISEIKFWIQPMFSFEISPLTLQPGGFSIQQSKEDERMWSEVRLRLLNFAIPTLPDFHWHSCANTRSMKEAPVLLLAEFVLLVIRWWKGEA